MQLPIFYARTKIYEVFTIPWIQVSGTNTNRYNELTTYSYLELSSSTLFKWLFSAGQLRESRTFLLKATLNYLKASHAL